MVVVVVVIIFMLSLWTGWRNHLTLIHLLSACPVQASTTYVYRHNLVARAVHWHFCKHYLLPLASKSWFSHNPSPVCEYSTTKLLWDFHLQSNSHHANNRPDIVLFTFPQKIYFLESPVLGMSMYDLKRKRRPASIFLWPGFSIWCTTWQLRWYR